MAKTKRNSRNSQISSEPDGPVLLRDVLAGLFAARGWGRRQERWRLESAWAEAVGPEMAKQTRVARLQRGVLDVLVANAVLMQELAGFHKRQLLERLRGRLSEVTLNDIRFRAGTWDL